MRDRGVDVELTPITTTGDRNRRPLDEIGGRGVFTKEIQLALLEGRIDLAVHSLKDLPTTAVPGLAVAAAPERGPAGDALVLAAGRLLRTCPGERDSSGESSVLSRLPHAARVGTGSLRRRAQLLHLRRDLEMVDIRGNVDTRIRKLHEGACDALLLAEAGLRRLGLAEEIADAVPTAVILPAPGQGALALEIRDDDATTRGIVAPLDDPATLAAVRAERAMLAALEGGCLAPIAALGRVERGRLTLVGRVISGDGARMLETSHEAAMDEAEALGRRAADALLAQGAGELIHAARA